MNKQIKHFCKLFVLVLTVMNLGVLSSFAEEGKTIDKDGINYEILPDGTAKVVHIYTDSEEVIIPEEIENVTVSTIGRRVLLEYESPYVKRIVLPSSITMIETEAFDLSTLEDICFSDENPVYEINHNSIIRKSDQTLIYFFSGLETTEYSIPEGIKAIAQKAFTGPTNITSLTIPESISDIEEGAFVDCQNLQQINLSADNSSFFIQDKVLYSKKDSVLLYYPYYLQQEKYSIIEGTKRIGAYAFQGCHLLNVYIPDSVESIGDMAFENSSNLIFAHLPMGLLSLGDYVFSSCDSLVIKELPENLETIG